MFRFIGRGLGPLLLCGALCAVQVANAGPTKPPSAHDAEYRGFVIQGAVAGASQLDVLVLDTRGEPIDSALYDLKDSAFQAVLPLPLGVEAVLQIKALGQKGEILSESKALVRFNDAHYGASIVALASDRGAPLGAVEVSPLGLRLDAVDTYEAGLLRYELRAFDADGREVPLVPDEVSWEIPYPPRTEYNPCKPSGSVPCVEFRVPVNGKLITRPTVTACVLSSICLQEVKTPPAQSVNGFKTITAGYTHTCGLTYDGRILCWGANNDKQLARVTAETCSLPLPFPGPSKCGRLPLEIICPQGSSCRYTALDAGFKHTCAIDTAGAVWCWGANASQQLGFACEVENPAPDCSVTATPRLVNIPGAPEDQAPRFVQVSAGEAHTCALSAKGNVYCWGMNSHSQLGSPSLSEPRVASSPNKYIQVSAGTYHTCAVTTTGNLDCWGGNDFERLYPGSTHDFLVTPTDVRARHPGLVGRVTLVAANEFNTCANAEVSGVVCWGGGVSGDHTVSTASATELELASIGPGLNSAIPDEVCAVVAGEVACGLPQGTLTTVPGSAPGYIDVAAGGGYGHYCGVLMTGQARCWGRNYEGQLGDGSTADHAVPGRVLGP